MKYKGKAIAGSNLLTILGVVCFATIVVAAAITFTAVNWTNTVPSAPGAVTKGLTGDGTNLPDNPAISTAYTFRLNVTSNIDTTVGSVVITITDPTILAANVTLIYDADNNGLYAETALTPVVGSGVLTFTIGAGALVWTATQSYNYDFQITYNNAGSYAVSAYATA